MSEKKVIIHYSSNWADEFDVEGFLVWSAADWQEHETLVNKLFDSMKNPDPIPEPAEKYSDEWYAWRDGRRGEVEVSFGTNESISYETAEGYFSDFQVADLSDSDFSVLSRLFGTDSRGRISNGTVVMMDYQLDRVRPQEIDGYDEDEGTE